MTQDEFSRVSLVGTDKARLSQAALDPQLGQMLTAMNGTDPTTELLGVAGAHSLRSMAGYQVEPSPADLPAPASAPEEKPLCSDRTAKMLKRLLDDNPEKQPELILQWCDACAAARQRVPPYLLPRLLPFGGRYYHRIERVLPVVGERGKWLANHMDGADGRQARSLVGAIDRQLWDDWLSRGNVVELFGAWRYWDADAARDALARDQDEVAVKTRVSLVETLRVGLSASDERLLESLLDVRSKQVAAAAANVLCVLPQSAYIARNIERLQGRVGVVKKRRKTKIGTTMFDELSKEMERDGLGTNPKRFNEKAFWFYNAVRAVPPSHWARELAVSPNYMVPLLFANGEQTLNFNGPFGFGVREAIVNHRDKTWAEAWLAHFIAKTRFRLSNDDPEAKMAAMLPPETVEAMLTAEFQPILSGRDKANERGLNLLDTLCQHTWSKGFSDTVMDYLALLIPNRSHAYLLARHLAEFSMRCATDHVATAYDRLMPLVEKHGNPGYLSKPMSEFLLVLKLRKDIQDAFAS
jgi:hypothetical protein